MPQPTDKHREQQVEPDAGRASTIASQRNVQVVPQPGRERDVPPSPKLSNVLGEMGPTKILGKVEAHRERGTNRDVAVA